MNRYINLFVYILTSILLVITLIIITNEILMLEIKSTNSIIVEWIAKSGSIFSTYFVLKQIQNEIEKYFPFLSEDNKLTSS